MVTATRRRTIGDDESTENTLVNGLGETNAKRKSESTNSTNNGTTRNKRRKKTSPEPEQEQGNEKTEPSKNGAHMRFDSEEPTVPEIAEPAQIVDDQEENQDDSSDDDEAPEAVDNAAILSKIKSDAKKQEKAKQIEEQLRRDKRRELDEKRKLQAKSSTKRKDIPAPEDVSESSETIQGSFTHDTRRSTIPTLLPDDLLNAVPEIRPPTPPPDRLDIAQKKPTKLRFLDKKEKAPKDVRMGDVTIRVLKDNTSRTQPGSSLPPKASKSGRNSRENWLQQTRSTGHVNGLRRNGTSKGFIRK